MKKFLIPILFSLSLLVSSPVNSADFSECVELSLLQTKVEETVVMSSGLIPFEVMNIYIQSYLRTGDINPDYKFDEFVIFKTKGGYGLANLEGGSLVCSYIGIPPYIYQGLKELAGENS